MAPKFGFARARSAVAAGLALHPWILPYPLFKSGCVSHPRGYGGRCPRRETSFHGILHRLFPKLLQFNLLQGLLKRLTDFKFYRCSVGDNHLFFRTAGIAANAALADLDFEDTEVAEFHILASQESLGNHIKSCLQHFADIFLRNTQLLMNADN